MPDKYKRGVYKVFCLGVAVVSFASLLFGQRPAEPNARQKEHAKLYRQYKTGKNLPKLATSGTGDINVGTVLISDGGITLASRPSYPNRFLVDFAFSADLVLVGTVKTSTSALTESEDFVFTDWQMAVDEVFKNNPLAPVIKGTEITVTRAGGTLVLNGRNIHAVDGAFLPFREGGRYLLFLFYLPATGAYRALNDQSFELLGRVVRPLRPQTPYFPAVTKQDSQAFLAEVQAAVAAAAAGPR